MHLKSMGLIVKIGLLISIILIQSGSIFAQVSNTVSSISFGELKDGNSIDIKVSLLNPSAISRVQIVYKFFQDTDFRVREMEMVGDFANYQIAAEDVSTPMLTYYLIIEMKNGSRETYPLGVPDAARPIDLTVSTITEKDKEILILSPGSNETVSVNDLFISISLVNAPDTVDIKKTKIILNSIDISKDVLFAGDLLLYYPQNFEGSSQIGDQNLVIEVFDKAGSLYYTTKRSFSTVDAMAANEIGRGLKYNGNILGKVGSESFDGTSTTYNNISLTLNADVGDWRFKGYGYVTSEENNTIQPQNRYSVSASSSWLNLRGGDSYPRYNNLLLNGKRIRGLDAKLDYGLFHLQGSIGQVRREVEGELINTYTNDNTPLQTNVVRIDSTKHGAPFGMVEFGVHARSLQSARIGVGSQNGFDFGFSFLHAKDDVNSIEFGGRPVENIVTSADLRLALDDQRIILKGVSAVSVLNSDISSGTYTDDQIDTIFAPGNELGNDAESFKDIKNALSPFFTVNQFIEPINPAELSSLAAEGSLELNYFNNNLKGSYVYRGNQFKSFGQEYTRTDIAGLNISDRFRTYDNQLFFSFGYEDLKDNLQDTKIATTTFKTLRASISIFMRRDMPNVTLSYTNNKNQNGIVPTDSINRFLSVNDITNRYSLNLGYDFNLKVRHNSSLGIMTSNREDNSYYNNDANYLSTSFTLNSYWTRALNTNFMATYYDSKISTEIYKYVSFSLGGRYKLLNDDMELSLNYSPSFGDFNRHAIDLGAAYQVITSLWLRGQLRYYSVEGSSANTISGISVSYNF